MNETRQEECTCDTCGHTFQGELLVRENRVIHRPRECGECRQKREAEEQRETQEAEALAMMKLRAQWRRSISSLGGLTTPCGIPPQLLSRTFENFERPAQRKACDQIRQWARDFPLEYSPDYPSLMLYSDKDVYGVGKTHLLVAAANWIIDHWQGDPELATCPVRFETGPGLVRRLRATYNVADELKPYHETEEMVYASLRGVKLLILDDVGKETPSNHTRELYFHIINERLNWGLPVLLSANLDPESSDFEEVVGGATVSRIMGMIRGKCYQLAGEDWRLKEKRP